MSQMAATERIDDLQKISLDELMGAAALLTRVDRKYLVTPAQLGALLTRLGSEHSPRVLDIDGCRRFGYESVYFDTPGFDSYLGAVRRRPGRFKVRTRCYLDSGSCWLETKLRSSSGQTIKHRVPHAGDRFVLSAMDRHSLGDQRTVAPHAAALHPVLTTRYTRSTLVVDSCRVTIDVEVALEDPVGRVTFGDRLIVETKSRSGAGPVDRVLWSVGIRPATVSKFGVGIAALHPDLPRNKWHRIVRDCTSLEPR